MSSSFDAGVRPPAGHAGQRQDIQVLRGIAVLAVVLYHAGLRELPAGFLGVDVFFVISGFLVTRMITDRLDAGPFSFGEFYLRRARRLLPAAYCSFSATAALALVFLTHAELRAFAAQLIGAVTFSSNLVLWRQTGYFDGAAQLKPLLHVWSLSLEEQFYLALPVFLVLAPPRRRLAATAAVLLLSLALFAVASAVSPRAAFYLMPTRAWELLLGSLCAVVQQRWPPLRMPRWLSALGLLAVLVLPAHPLDPGYPPADDVLVTLATALLLMGRLRPLDGRSTRPLAAIGDRSYSLYLVHWPLIAFAHNAWLGELPRGAGAAIALLALALADLQYRLVECRYRYRRTPARRFLAAVAAASLVLAAAIAVEGAAAVPRGATDYAAMRRPNYGLSPTCEFAGAFAERPACMTSPTPRVAVWGDSYAMHLVPGLAASPSGDGLVQMTRSQCGPVLGLAIVTPRGDHNPYWARSCIDFNASVLAYLEAHGGIQTVVMSANFQTYLAGDVRFYSGGDVRPIDAALLASQLDRTIRAVQALGKAVVLVAPPPSFGFDIGACLERMETGKIVWGRASCDFPEDAYLHRNAPLVSLLDAVQRSTGADVIWPGEVLCRAGVCRAQIDGVPIYRDAGHLSVEGSVRYAALAGLGRRISSANARNQRGRRRGPSRRPAAPAKSSTRRTRAGGPPAQPAATPSRAPMHQVAAPAAAPIASMRSPPATAPRPVKRLSAAPTVKRAAAVSAMVASSAAPR